jgi:cell division protein ZapD
MRPDFLIYQFPTNYLTKVSLYLENLFSSISTACESNEQILHYHALKSIIDIINLIEKPEIKSRYVKELMRIEHLINQSQAVISDRAYASLFVQLQVLGKINSRFGSTLYQDSFIQAMRFIFNSKDESEILNPQLIFWLNKDLAHRQNDISSWLENLLPVYNTVDTYLSILRETANFITIDIESGYYNKNISNKLTQHLIVIKMSNLDGIIPKVNLTNNVISIRLCDAYSMQEVRGSEDFQLELAVCQL